MKWYQRDPDAALVGMRSLTDEQFRAYSVIIDLLYSQDGDLDDDPRVICTHLGWNKQRWLRVRSELFALFKIRMKLPGKLTANRVENTLLSAEKVSEKFRTFRAKRKQNQRSALADVTSNPNPNPNPHHKSANGKENNSKIKQVRQKKPTMPLPDDFSPSEQTLGGLMAKGWSATQIHHELERFKNYCLKSGKQYVDYQAAFRDRFDSQYQHNRPENGYAEPVFR